MKLFDHNSGHYFEADDAKIYYEKIGDKEKPTLLMLHGGFENIENLNSIASYLVDNFYIIGVDSRAQGKSTSGKSKLTYARMEEDLIKLLQFLKIDTLNILGFSDGGITAYRLAANSIFNIEKLITIGAAWCNSDIDKTEEIIKEVTPESAKEMFAENYSSYEKLNPEADFEKLTDSITALWLDKSSNGHPNQSVSQIRAETLLIRGDNDFLLSLDSLVELQSKIEGAALLNVPFAEHVVHDEQPEILETILKQFLKIG